VQTGGGYRIEGYAIFSPNEKTVWFALEGFRDTIKIDLEDLGKAKQVHRYFNNIFNEYIFAKTPMRKIPASILDAGCFYAEWIFHRERLPELLDAIETNIGKSWRDAIRSLLRGRDARARDFRDRPNI